MEKHSDSGLSLAGSWNLLAIHNSWPITRWIRAISGSGFLMASGAMEKMCLRLGCGPRLTDLIALRKLS